MVVKNVKNEVLEDRTFRFYRIMWYPIPKNRNVFSYWLKWEVKEWLSDFAWDEKSDYLDEYLSYINKWWWLYKNFPFVREIYLANSISFNSLTSDSDIDLFVVCEKWRVRTARLIVSFLMMFYWIKRTKKNYNKRFCLSFFVDEDNVGLERILLWKKDVYLTYWVAHLVPLYLENNKPSVYVKNSWLQRYLPNIELKQNIFLWNKLFSGKWLVKKFIEFLLGWKFWWMLENFIQKKWGSRMKKIMAKNQEAHVWTVCEKWMLKFYKDMRKYYSDLFFWDDN